MPKGSQRWPNRDLRRSFPLARERQTSPRFDGVYKSVDGELIVGFFPHGTVQWSGQTGAWRVDDHELLVTTDTAQYAGAIDLESIFVLGTRITDDSPRQPHTARAAISSDRLTEQSLRTASRSGCSACCRLCTYGLRTLRDSEAIASAGCARRAKRVSRRAARRPRPDECGSRGVVQDVASIGDGSFCVDETQGSGLNGRGCVSFHAAPTPCEFHQRAPLPLSSYALDGSPER